MRKVQLKFICHIDNAMPRVKGNCIFANKQSQQPISPITKFSIILFHLLSVEIKQRKFANLERKQRHSNWAWCYHRWLRVRWLWSNLFPTTSTYLHKWLNTANRELILLEKIAVFSEEVATAKGPASIFLQKNVCYFYITDQREWSKTR